jgi:cytochrome P450
MAAAAKLGLPPHPKDKPLVGSVPAFIRDTPQTFIDGWRECGDVVRFRGIRPMVLVTHPESVQHVLEDNNSNYRRSDTVTEALTMLLGESSFTAQGDTWRRRARLVHPLLSPERLRSLSECWAAACAETALRLDRAATAGETLDLYDTMRTTSLNATARILFGADRGGDFGRFRDAAVTANEYVIAKTMAVGGPPDVRIRPAYRRYLRAVEALEVTIGRITAERRKQSGDDLVSALVDAQGEDGRRLTDRDVRDEALTFLHVVYAGVASGLMWVLALLAQHPDIHDRVLSEFDDAIGDRPVTVESTSVLRYLSAVIDETLRLYPSLWVFAVVPAKDDAIGGYDIPAGMSVVISPYITHRHPEFWEDPERFQPQRFADQPSDARHPYAYFPFSGGPRKCPAPELALSMIRIGVTTIIRRHQIELVPGHVIARRREFVLRPSNGMPVRVSSLAREPAAMATARTPTTSNSPTGAE